MISGSVGRNGRNQRPDVIAVQTLLNRHMAALAPLRPLAIDGECGTSTIEAIVQFQRRIMGQAAPDGRVDVNGRTFVRLTGQGGAAAPATTTTATGFDYTPGTQAPLADIAAPYLGATEARHNGMGTDPRMREIFEADHLMNGDRTDGYPWCCSFVSMCLQKLIRQTPAYNHVLPPTTASVLNFRTRWAPGQNCLIFTPNDAAQTPHRGDVLVYTFSHIGIVTAVGASSVSTIEGNTNAAGSREGTTVERKERNLSLVRCFIRLPLLASRQPGAMPAAAGTMLA